jgi:hypothetical protein
MHLLKLSRLTSADGKSHNSSLHKTDIRRAILASPVFETAVYKYVVRVQPRYHEGLLL